jgi:hypothetical protein
MDPPPKSQPRRRRLLRCHRTLTSQSDDLQKFILLDDKRGVFAYYLDEKRGVFVYLLDDFGGVCQNVCGGNQRR